MNKLLSNCVLVVTQWDMGYDPDKMISNKVLPLS